MNDVTEIHDGLNDIRHEGRREGFYAGVILCAGLYAYSRLRKTYTIKERKSVWTAPPQN